MDGVGRLAFFQVLSLLPPPLRVLALEMQKELLYEDEKSTCRALISHMQKLSLAGEGSYSPATTRAAAAASDPAPLQHSTSEPHHSVVTVRNGMYMYMCMCVYH